jgi:hypothetical protein
VPEALRRCPAPRDAVGPSTGADLAVLQTLGLLQRLAAAWNRFRRRRPDVESRLIINTFNE